MKITLLIVNISLALSLFAQELPRDPSIVEKGSDGFVEFNARSGVNGTQSIVSTLGAVNKGRYSAQEYFIGTSIDGISFDETNNSITLGVKARMDISGNKFVDGSGGASADYNPLYNELMFRGARSVVIAKNVRFDHGASLGYYRNKRIDPELGQERFTIGPEIGLRISFEVGEDYLYFSNRTSYHFQPSGEDFVANENSARILTVNELVFEGDRLSIFLGSRFDLFTLKDYLEQNNIMSFGLRIPVRPIDEVE